MNFSDSTALRHRPRQARGQKKVEHILRSAEALFAEIGFVQATTNAIAIKAGISIGSLYQFFASKEAILSAMADRYISQSGDAVKKGLDECTDVGLEELLTGLLDTLVKLQEQRPLFLQCLTHSSPSPVLASAIAEVSETVTQQFMEVLERRTVETDPKLLMLRTRICVEAAATLLPLAVNTHGRERKQAIREIVLMLTRYLEPVLKPQGVK